MKRLRIICLLICSFFKLTVAQSGYFYQEKLSGNVLDYSFAMKFVHLLETGRIDSIRVYLLPNYNPDTNLLRMELSYMNRYFSSNSYAFNGCDCYYKGSHHLYARAFWGQDTVDKIPIKFFAVMFQMKHNGIRTEVDSLDFLCDEVWVRKSSDLIPPQEIIEKKIEFIKNHPPPPIPPPPPRDLINKH